MMNNRHYYSSLTAFMLETGWKISAQNNQTMNTWVHDDVSIRITMPKEEYLDDEHAHIFYERAVKILAKTQSLSPQEIINKLQDLKVNSDLISVRSVGNAIEHGKINLFSGSKALSAAASLLKACANKHAIAKKGFKQKLEEHYLNSLKLVVPGAGSFIHRIEVDLHPFMAEIEKAAEENHQLDAVPANRSINIKLAKLLIAIRDIDPNTITVANLLQLGLNEQISNCLINSFTEDADEVEFKFTWSPTYEPPQLETNTVVFDRSHRETLKKVKSAFSGTLSFPIKELAAHIDDYSTPKDGSSGLTLNMELEGRSRICDVLVDRKVVEQLMAEMSEDSQRSVTVSGTVTRETKNQSNVYTLSDAIIFPSTTKQIPLFKS